MLRKSFVSRRVSQRVSQNRTIFRDEELTKVVECVCKLLPPVSLLHNKPVIDGNGNVFQSPTGKEVGFMGVRSII